MPRRKEEPSYRGQVSVQFRMEHALYFDDFSTLRGRPMQTGGGGHVGFHLIQWSSDWFDPKAQFYNAFPYVGSFDSRFSRIIFACDGKEVASVETWAQSVPEMDTMPPRRPDGEVDTERLEQFSRYRAVRARAEDIIHAEARSGESR